MDNDSHSPSQSTVDRIFTKIDEQNAMHMRTREDLLEMKGDVRVLKENQALHNSRQVEFEKDIEGRLDERFRDTDVRLTDLDGRVSKIHEERIAEKAQWRGPEKVMAFLIAIGGSFSLVLALKDIFAPGQTSQAFTLVQHLLH